MKNEFLIIIIFMIFYNNFELFSDWNECELPYKGDITAMYVYGKNDLIVGTLSNGVYLCHHNNYYDLWNKRQILKIENEITSILLKNNNYIVSTMGRGIFVSTDNGISWLSNVNGINVTSLVEYEGKLFASTIGYGIYQSSDNGINWNNILDDKNNNFTTLYIFSGKLYAGTDKGKILNYSVTDDTLSLIDSKQVSTSKINSFSHLKNQLFTGTVSNGIFILDTIAEIWYSSNNGLSSPKVTSLSVYNDTMYAATYGSGIYIFNKESLNWSQTNFGLSTLEVLTLGNNNEGIFAGTLNGEVYLLEYWNWGNKFRWTGVLDFETREPYYRMVKAKDKLFAFSGFEIFESSDKGDTWLKNKTEINQNEFRALHSYKDMIFLGTVNGVYCSEDLGVSWNPTNDGLNNLVIFSFCNVENDLFVGTQDGLYKFDNVLKTWELINSEIAKFPLNTMTSRNDTIFAGSWGEGISISIDKGKTWNTRNNGLTVKHLRSIIFKDEFVFAATFTGGVFQSSDYGMSWFSKNDGIKDLSLQSMILIDNKLFAKGEFSIFYSKNDGVNWNQVEMDGIRGWAGHIFGIDETIFNSTSRGLFKKNASDFDIPNNIEFNSYFKTSILSPNPAYDYIEINTGNKEHQLFAENAKIQIYDVFGNEVISKLSAAADISQVGNLRIDISGLAAGVYFIRIGDKTEKFVKM